MANNRIKPDILSTNTLLRRNLIASAPSTFEELPLDTTRGNLGENRHMEIRRDTDTHSSYGITVENSASRWILSR